VVSGKADKPVYISIDGDKVEIRDAAHLMGKTAFQREKTIKDELGDSVRVVTVGPAATIW